MPSASLRPAQGLHSKDFRHNLISVRQLLGHGIEVRFPARSRSAHCVDPSSGKVLCTFKQGSEGLYEAQVSSTPADQLGVSAHSSWTQGDPQRSGFSNQARALLSHAAAGLHPTVLLHRRLGHLGAASIKTLISKEAIKGLPPVYVPPPVPFQQDCVTSIESKTQASPHPLTNSRAAAPLDKVHVDLVGPFPSGLRGHRYWLTIVDDYTRYGWVVLLHSKDQTRANRVDGSSGAQDRPAAQTPTWRQRGRISQLRTARASAGAWSVLVILQPPLT